MKRLSAVLLLSIGACAGPPPGSPASAPAPVAAVPAVGADRDAHGCIGSAGQAWCARTQRCERPWELAAAEGFENSADAFARYCAARP